MAPSKLAPAQRGAASFGPQLQIYLKTHLIAPGQVIEGAVQLKASSGLTASDLAIRFTGKERTSLPVEVEDSKGDKVTTQGKERMLYFKSHQSIFEGDQVALTPGEEYVFPFAYKLPTNIPTNFSLTHNKNTCVAEVVYSVKAYLMSPSTAPEYAAKTKTLFSVMKPIPASQYGEWGDDSIFYKHSDHFQCCGCIDQGMASTEYFIGRRLMATDRDAANVVADIDCGMSKTDVKQMKVKLVRKVFVRCQTKHTQYEEEVLKNKIGGEEKSQPLAKKTERAFGSGLLQYPLDLPPTFVGFNAKIQYYLELTLKPGWGSGEITRIPVNVVSSVSETGAVSEANFEKNAFPSSGEDSAKIYVPYEVPARPVTTLVAPHGAPAPQVAELIEPEDGIETPANMCQASVMPAINGQLVTQYHGKPSHWPPWNQGYSQPFAEEVSKPTTATFPAEWSEDASLTPSHTVSSRSISGSAMHREEIKNKRSKVPY